MHSENLLPGLRKPFNPWLLPLVGDELEMECTCCHESWPLDEEFWFRESKARTGFTTQCKACLQEKAALKKAASRPEKPLKVKAVLSDRKSCTKCGSDHPRNDLHFRRNPDKADGLTSHCKACLKLHDKARRSSLKSCTKA
jgi:hypothetical protein